MLARAAGRKIRRDACSIPTQRPHQLTLPWLCPRQFRWSSTTSPITAHILDSRRQRTSNSTAPRHETRTLATSADAQPALSSLPLDGFMQAWGPRAQPADISHLQSWNPSNPLIVNDMTSAVPNGFRSHQGFGADPTELHQNLHACLRVGRMDRASTILDRLAAMYQPAAPEVVDAHNNFLQAMFELAQQDHKDDSFTKIEAWYEAKMIGRSIQSSAQTFVTLLRAAMNFLEDSVQEDAIRRLLATADECGHGTVNEINESPDFSDEEWDILIRLQSDAFDEPPSVEQVQELHVNTPNGQKNLIEHGLYVSQKIKPVQQKGLGLDSLKMALATFEPGKEVPYPHDMEGTQEEKDRAYAYARQLRLEEDASGAAVERWKAEDAKLQEMGIYGVLSTKPIQALAYNWYSALSPVFKKHIEKAVLLEDPRDDAMAYAAWLQRCNPDKLAAITISRILQACVRGKNHDEAALKISALTTSIGTEIQDYLNSDKQIRREAFLAKQRKETRKRLVEELSRREATSDESTDTPAGITVSQRSHMDMFEKTEIPLTVRTKIGALAMELLMESATITVSAEDPKTGKKLSSTHAAFHHQIGYHQGKKIGWVAPHHAILSKLRNESVQDIQTVKLPMLIEPRPWAGFDLGAYYTTPERVVRQKSADSAQKAYARTAIDKGDMSKILAALDLLGRVPWQVNTSVLSVMTEVWNSGMDLAGILPEHIDMEPPVEPPADSSYQERAKYGKQLQDFMNLKQGLHSQRCFQNFQLETARAFANEEKMYFPHSVDFRGRAYPIPPVLNHIGSDVARGLLKFANGKELGDVGLQWLKVHLANLYGFDKASLREREQFAMDHIDEIHDSATKPLEGNRWWTKAEDPWQCLACCIELKNALDSPDPTKYLSQLPVHQDGTCNGLQHYAALGGDEAGARQVNLEPSDRPQDIYTGVAEMVKEMVVKDAAEGHAYAQFIDGHITRKVVKRTVMTNVYGVTFMGATAQVHDELKSAFPQFQPTNTVKSLHSVSLYIAYKIFEALGRIFNGAQEIQYWLGECGDRITTSIAADQVKDIKARYEGKELSFDPKYKVPKKVSGSLTNKIYKNMEVFKTSIIWTSPLKMPIVQPYRKSGQARIKTKLQDITVTKKNHTDMVDKRKQLQAFPPNFIHSLDATHMTLSALKCSEEGLDFAAVHDSFWTHASDIPKLNVILRDAFVRMHSEDIMGRLTAEFSARYSGAMYRANILCSSKVGSLISKWRSYHRQANPLSNNAKTVGKNGVAPYDEVALEARRQELLASEDPELRKQGEEMVTPTSIWLENQDPMAIASFRLHLLGETKATRKESDTFSEVKKKVVGAEIEAMEAEAAENSEVGTIESTLLVDEEKGMEEEVEEVEEAEEMEEVEESEETDQPAPRKTRVKSGAAAMSDKATLQAWLPLTFPPVPKKGSWDVSRLRESQYFFS